MYSLVICGYSCSIVQFLFTVHMRFNPVFVVTLRRSFWCWSIIINVCIFLFWGRYLGYRNKGIYAVSRCISNLSLSPYRYILAPPNTSKRLKPPMPNPTNQNPKTPQPKQILKSIKIIRLTKRQLIPILNLNTSPNHRIHIHRTIPIQNPIKSTR